MPWLDLFTVFSSNVPDGNLFCQLTLRDQKESDFYNHTLPTEQLPLKKHVPIDSTRLREPKEFAFKTETKIDGALKNLNEVLSTHFNPPQLKKKTLGKFPLKDSKDPLEQRLIDTLKVGHEKIQDQPEYTLKTNATLLKNDLENLSLKLSGQTKNLEEELLEELKFLSNSFSQEEKAYVQMAWMTKSLSEPTLADLITLHLSGDPKPLLKKNPCLTEEMAKQLSSKFIQYLSVASEYAQVQEALKEVLFYISSKDPFSIQKTGILLDQKRGYKLDEHPEFLIYEWAASKILRLDQVTKLLEIFEAAKKNGRLDMLLEFAAGGGKTKVMMPIIAFTLAKMGYLPVINTASPLYTIAKEDMSLSLQAAFEQMCEVIEINIDDEISLEKLETISKSLPIWKKDKKALLIQAETWDALYIARLVALSEKDEKKYEALDEILTFLEKDGFRIVDESHQTDSPLTETLRSFGNPQSIPLLQQKLLLKAYDYLNQLSPRLKEGTLSLMQEKEKADLMQKLMQKLIEDKKLFKNVDKNNLLTYLKEASKVRPEWLKKANPEVGNLVVLTKALFTTFLPHIFTLRTHIDFGDSIHQGDLTIAPRQFTYPLRSRFAVHTLTMALTIQETYRRGLSSKEMKIVVSNLIEKILKERQKGSSATESGLERIFGKKIPILQIDVKDEMVMEKVAQDFGSRKKMMNLYLMQYALSQIKVQGSQFCVTPAERSQGFQKNLYISATPGIKEVYSVGLKDEEYSWRDPSFSSEVVATLCQDKNKETFVLDIDPKNLKAFFTTLFKKVCPCALLDRGGLCRLVNNKEFVSVLLEEAKNLDEKNRYTGGLHFEEEQLLYQRVKENKTISLKGSELAVALKKEGIEFTQELIFTLFKIDKTTGLDLKQPNHGVGVLTVGEKQTLTETIQAAMRLRLFLWENGQTLCWVVPPEVEKEIEKQGEVSSVPERLQTMLKTEADQYKKALLVRARQGIKALINGVAVREIQSKETFVNKADCYQLRKKGFEQTLSINPLDLYELETKSEPTRKVLESLALKQYHLLGYEDNQLKKLGEPEKEKLEMLIAQTEKLIQTMDMGNQGALDQKMTQYQEQTTEMNEDMLKNQQDRTVDAAHNEKTHSMLKSFLSSSNTLNTRLNLNLPPLFFNEDYFNIAGFDGMKPVRAILVMPEGSYYSLSAHELEMVLKLGINSSDNFLIVDEKGRVLKNNHNLLNQEEVEKLTQPEEFQDILLFAALLRGQAEEIPEILLMLKKYGWTRQHFQTFWDWLQNMHVSNTPIDSIGFSNIKKGLEEKITLIPEKEKEIVQDSVRKDNFTDKKETSQTDSQVRTDSSVIQPIIGTPLATRNNRCITAKTVGKVLLLALEVAALVVGIFALLAVLKVYQVPILGPSLLGIGIIGSSVWVGVASTALIITCLALLISSLKLQKDRLRDK